MKLPLGEKLNSAKGGFAFTADVLFYIVVSMIASIIISANGLKDTEAGSYISYLVSPVAITITLAVYFKLADQKPREVLNFKCKPKYYLIAFMLIFGLLFSLSWLNEYFVRLLQLLGYTPQSNSLPDYSGAKIIPVLIVIAVIPAILEETLFRGVILNNAESSTGTVAAVLLNGLCFMLFHGSVQQTIYQFVCGCLFALLALRSGSIIPTVLIHFLNNAVIIILSACGCYDANGFLAVPTAVNIVIIVLSALSFIGAVLLLIFDKKPLKNGEKGSVARFFILASLGIFIMSLMWVLSIFS